MARKFLTPIDLNGLELLNARVQNLATEPSPLAGRLFFHTGTLKFGVGNGTDFDYQGDADGVADVAHGGTGRATSTTAFGLLAAGTTATGAQQTLDVGTAGQLLKSNGAALPTFQTGAPGDVALGSVDNTSDLAKPLSTAAIAESAVAKARANHTGTQVASTISDFDAAADARIALIVDAAPGTLDTLNELAAALGDDANFAATTAASLATKVTKFAVTIGDAVATSIAVTHDLGTKDITYSVRQVADDVFVECDAVSTSTSVLTLTFAVAPATSALRIAVHA